MERLVRNDEAARFQTRGQSDRFQGYKTTIFLNGEVASSGVDDSHTGFKRDEKSAKMTIWFQNPAQKLNPDKEPSQKGFDDGYMIMSRCMAFGSPIASRYAQPNNITSEQQNLIMTPIRS
jgi:hypothetical protein